MKEILCFGDSNTFGLVPGTWNRYPREVRWTGILEEKLYNKGYRIVEEGLCGRTTVFEDELRNDRRGCDLLPALLESHKPLDRIILMLGTNDCKSYFRASAEVIGKGIELLLQQIQTGAPEAQVLLVSPIHLGEDVWKSEYDPEFDKKSIDTSKALKTVYQKIAVKYGCDFLAASDVAVASHTDMEHLDEENHRRLAGAILQKIVDD